MGRTKKRSHVMRSCTIEKLSYVRKEGERERESSVEVKGMESVALSELSIIRDVPSIKYYVACFTLVLLCPFQFT